MKKLLKLIVSLAAIYALWLAYNAFDGSTQPNTHATSRSRSTSEFSAFSTGSNLSEVDVSILSAKFNEADRSWARSETCKRARISAAERPRHISTTVAAISAAGFDALDPDPTMAVQLYARTFTLEDELNHRETLTSAFAVTAADNWTYFSPAVFGRLEPAIRDALATVP